MNILYKTSATSTGGRDGRAVSADNKLEVKLAAPRELGGTGAEGTNPEQLFAAGYSACFLSAMKFVAGQNKQTLPADTQVTAEVGIGPNDAGGFGLDIELRVSLPGLDKNDAQVLVDKAHHGVPVFERHAQQRAGAPDGRLTRHRFRAQEIQKGRVRHGAARALLRDSSKWRAGRPACAA